MHKVSISQSIIDRVVARRGREHIFDDLVPAKTALVVVDMQNGFMLPEVGHAPCPMAFEIVPNINRLAQAVRDTGGTVIWIQTAYTDETLTSWSTLYGMVGPKGEEKRRRSLSVGGKGYELFAGLKVEPQDLIVEKKRYSAFIQGSSNIEEVLRARGLDTLLITGTVTNVCCEFDRARRHDAQLQDRHDHRRQRRQHRRGPQRGAQQFLSDLRRHHVDRFRHRLPDAQRAEGPRRGGVECSLVLPRSLHPPHSPSKTGVNALSRGRVKRASGASRAQ